MPPPARQTRQAGLSAPAGPLLPAPADAMPAAAREHAKREAIREASRKSGTARTFRREESGGIFWKSPGGRSCAERATKYARSDPPRGWQLPRLAPGTLEPAARLLANKREDSAAGRLRAKLAALLQPLDGNRGRVNIVARVVQVHREVVGARGQARLSEPTLCESALRIPSKPTLCVPSGLALRVPSEPALHVRSGPDPLGLGDETRDENHAQAHRGYERDRQRGRDED
eukprot:CAMPEP_0180014174 /NCGR_PEP_ID=MMETSP0984-20121128/17995_1 /TAXON_ID=483367 /ORGANISM="non described non described, Strain CCMP 2436" /LENGTH=229 /DNA_ID=CAMNT_0021936749 /DNA_START=136 /DNA_END=826 /DNA_ORIENTATION=+